MRGPLSFLAFALGIGAIVGSLALAGPARAEGEPIERQDNSLERGIDGFVAYLKSETYDAVSEAARLAREHHDEIEAAKKTLHSRLAELGAALSGRKARADTLARDAMARLEAWSRSAGVSWDDAEHLAQTMLDRLNAWLRGHVPSNESEEIPV